MQANALLCMKPFRRPLRKGQVLKMELHAMEDRRATHLKADLLKEKHYFS